LFDLLLARVYAISDSLNSSIALVAAFMLFSRVAASWAEKVRRYLDLGSTSLNHGQLKCLEIFEYCMFESRKLSAESRITWALAPATF